MSSGSAKTSGTGSAAGCEECGPCGPLPSTLTVDIYATDDAACCATQTVTLTNIGDCATGTGSIEWLGETAEGGVIGVYCQTGVTTVDGSGWLCDTDSAVAQGPASGTCNPLDITFTGIQITDSGLACLATIDFSVTE